MKEKLLYVNFSIVSDEDGERVYEEVIKRFRAVKEISHDFSPQGKTKIAILSSSHLALHTYPEEGYATLTLTTCDKEIVFNDILNFISHFFRINHVLYSSSAPKNCLTIDVASGIRNETTGTNSGEL